MYTGFDHQQTERGVIPQDGLPKFEPWVRHWNRAVSRAYVQAYCEKLAAIRESCPWNEEDKLTPYPAAGPYFAASNRG